MTAISPMSATLLCDLDGTLVDSAPDLLNALNRLLRERERATLDLTALVGMVGDGVKKLVERGFTATGDKPPESEIDDLVTRFLAIYESDLVLDSRLYPGVEDALVNLRTQGWRLAVCTNKPEQPSRLILERFGILDLFEAVSGGDSEPFKKPDPRHLLSTLDRLAAPVAGSVMLGDSVNDVRAAQAAGLPSVLVSFGYCRQPLSSLGADSIIDSFDELPSALSRLPVPL